jgi:CRP-like cAMP-binding protein
MSQAKFDRAIEAFCLQGQGQQYTIMEALREMRHFCGVLKENTSPIKNDVLLSRLAAAMQYEVFARGDIIFHKEDTGDKFYFILRGRASLWEPKTESELNEELRLKSEVLNIE